MEKFTVVQSLLLYLCVLMVIGVSLSSGQTKIGKNVICYYPIHGEFLSGVTVYNTSDIDPTICTHLVYYYTWIENGTLQTSGHGYDHVQVWNKFQNLRLSNPSLKSILEVDESMPVSESYEDRDTFINHAIDFLRTWNFDGIAWSWYSKPITQEVVTLTEELHEMIMSEATCIDREPLILMLTVPGWGAITEGVDLHPLGQSVDILHVTPHGNGGISKNHATLFVSPMYGNGGIYGNVSSSITDYLDAGIPSEKLHIGIKVTATTFTLDDPEITGIGAPAKYGGERGEFTHKTDRVAYYEVCKRLQEEGYTAELDPEGLVNFAYKGDQWMTYEDRASLQIKMNYVYDNNLGGVAVLFLHDDDYTGQFCNQGRYPLLSFLYILSAPRECPNGLDRFPDPYSCQHYIKCDFDMLSRAACDTGLYYDVVQKECVQNPTTTCSTVPPPTE